MLKFTIAILVIPATAGLAQTADTTSKGATGASGEKRVCRYMAPTGSIIGASICHTRAQWTAMDAANERAIENRRNSTAVQRSQGGAGGGTDSFGQSAK